MSAEHEAGVLKVKHTPGPWTTGDSVTGPTAANVSGPTVAGRNWGYAQVTVGLETIAICPNQTPGTARDEIKGSGDANARLIAAAPEMLSALLLVSALDIDHRVLKRVDAAIAKAGA